ncbi:hypothetical protein CYY_001929 [Polysphondylium violaceum]|uniref:Uncharacterized protein n=1 Tax=Polysphondylium violaceum TaxID=133409 RepID=A0A8J4V162_9MYCE|nr:hypothetical protein CYY_001929 [Polysphondylium violaceum]
MNNELFFRIFQNRVLRKHIFRVCKDDYLNDCLVYHKTPFDMFNYPILKICQERNLKLLEYRFQLFYNNTRLKLPNCHRFYSFKINEDSLMALFSWPNFPLSLFKRIYKELSEHMDHIIEKQDIISSLSKGNNYEIYQYLLKKHLKPPIVYSPEQLLSDGNQQLLHITILEALEIDNVGLVEYFIPQSKLLNFKLWNDKKHPPRSHIPLFGIDFVVDEKNHNKEYKQLIHRLIRALVNSKYLDLIKTVVLAFRLNLRQRISSLNIVCVCKSLEIFKWLDDYSPLFKFNLAECMKWACKTNDKPYVEFLVKKTKSAELFESDPPLESNYEIIRYLIQQKVSKNICFKETCLLDLEFLKYLDSHEPNFNVPLYSSQRVLIEAAKRDDIEIVRYIIETKGTVFSLDYLELNSKNKLPVKVLNYLYQSGFLVQTDLSLKLTSLIKDRWTLAGLDPSVKRFLQPFLFFINKTDPEYDCHFSSLRHKPLDKILEPVQLSRSLYRKYQPQFLRTMLQYVDVLFRGSFLKNERVNRELIIKNLDTQDYTIFDFILQRGVFDDYGWARKELVPVFIQIVKISLSKKKYNILAYLYLSQCFEFHPYLQGFGKLMLKYFEHYIPPQEEIQCKNKAKEYCSFLYSNTFK